MAHVDGGDLAVSAPLNPAIAGLAKGGPGKLVLSGSRAATLSGAISIAGSLEFQGAGTTLSGAISGPGALICNLNAGQILTINNTGNSYSGRTVARGGILRIGTAYNAQGLPGGNAGQFGTSNLEITNAIVSLPYYMSMGHGSGPGQWQITGGTAGFAGYGNDVIFNIFGRSSYEVVWGGDAFKPEVLVLGDAASSGALITWNNLIDLNGATRTISNSSVYASTIAGVIRTGGGVAGLNKAGVGELALTGANTFNGVVTVSGGTLAIASLANGGLASGLGTSSSGAANLLLGNGTTLKYTGGAAGTDRSFTINGTANGDGATLDASGSGAISFTNPACPAFGVGGQARTLTLTGTYGGTNNLAANLANNGAGALSVTKTGSGLWVLSGANTYTGTNTLSGGLLSVSAAGNLGAPSAGVVFGGGGLQIAGTTLTNLSGLGHAVSFTPGVTATFDIASTGNTFVIDQAVALGSGGIVKSGGGTLVLAQTNVYSGQTTVSGGTLRYDDGSVIPTTPLFNNAALVVNRSDTVTQGVNFHSVMGGTGTVTMAGAGTLSLNNANIHSGVTRANAGTLALSHPLALMNSPLDTTGAGAFTLSGVTAPTFGGLAGASGSLAAVISSGYGSVTNLILNPSGTATYGGVIADGAAGMTLTMAGAGTQVLQGAATHTGNTLLNAGTLTLSGSGSILNSAVAFGGGGLTLSYADSDAEMAFNRVNDGTGITANGGTLTYTTTTAGSARNFAETIGPVALVSGQLNVVETLSKTNGSQTLTLAGLTRAGAANASAIAFAAAGTGPQLSGNRNMIRVTGGGTTTAGQIIGPWATAGTAANAQTDYAIYVGDYVTNAGIAASAETTWSAATDAYTVSGGAALSGTRSITALRATGAAQTLNLGTSTLETYGLLNGGSGLLTVTNVAGGALTTPAGGGNLYLTAGNNAINVIAPVSDHGGAVAVVKSGAGTLTLSGSNTFGGDIVINAGTIDNATPTAFGTGTNTIFAGSGKLIPKYGVYPVFARSLAVNSGAIAELNTVNQYYQMTFTGPLAGSGTVFVNDSDTSAGGVVTFSSAANTFAGTLVIGSNQTATLIVNSLPDSPKPVRFVGANNQVFQLGSGAATPLVFNGRQIELAGTTGGATINNASASATNTITINSDLLVSGIGNKTLTLGGSTAGQTNVFAGRMGDGPGSVIGVTASGSSWTLAGTNTYSGTTIPDNVTLTLRGRAALSPNTAVYFDAYSGSAGSGGGKLYLLMDDAGIVNLGNPVSMRTAQTSAAAQWTIYVGNNGGATTGSVLALGKLNFDSIYDCRAAGATMNVQGTNGYGLLLSGADLNWAQAGAQGFNPTTASLTITGTVKQVNGRPATGTSVRTVTLGTTAQVLSLGGSASNNLVSGTIRNASDYDDGSNVNALPLSVTKAGTGEWILSGVNTYSGTTSVNGGTLVLAAGTCLPDTGTLAITAPGKVRLNAGVKERVGALKLGAVTQASGTWGSSASRAAFTNDTYFSGPGVLYVGVDLPPTGMTLTVY